LKNVKNLITSYLKDPVSWEYPIDGWASFPGQIGFLWIKNRDGVKENL